MKINIGQIVWLKTDEDQLPRIVTGVLHRQSSIVYELSQGNETSYHYPFEISTAKDELFSLGINAKSN